MTIYNTRPKAGKMQIDLSGPEGNAFVLLGIARSFGKQCGCSPEIIEEIRREMISGDYEHLIEVFDKEYGHLVDMYR